MLNTLDVELPRGIAHQEVHVDNEHKTVHKSGVYMWNYEAPQETYWFMSYICINYKQTQGIT